MASDRSYTKSADDALKLVDHGYDDLVKKTAAWREEAGEDKAKKTAKADAPKYTEFDFTPELDGEALIPITL